MSDNIKARTTADLLAYVDTRLGYRPTESLVVAFLREGTVGLVMRMDLADVEACLPEIARQAGIESASSAVITTYTDDDTTRSVERVSDAISTSAVDVHSVLTVTSTGYGFHGEGATSPLDAITNSPVAARLVFEGRTVAASREGALPQAASREAQDTAHAAAEKWKAETAGGASFAVAAWVVALNQMVDGPHVWGPIAAALGSRAVRDAALVATVTGTPEDLPLKMALDPEGNADAVTDVLRKITDPAASAAPDERTNRALDVLAHVIGHDPENAPAWTLWALLTWWGGNCGLATAAADKALAIDPEYRLAVLVRTATVAGMAPGWVAAQRG